MLLQYTARNLVARKGVVLPTAVAIALAVTAITVLLGLERGVVKVISATGRPQTAMVLSKGVAMEAWSDVPNAAIGTVKATPGVSAGKVSPELYSSVRMRVGSGLRSVT